MVYCFQQPLQYEEYLLQADLAAERASIIGDAARRIIIEVKSFIGPSFIHQLQQAIGQYGMYRDALELSGLNYELYLAISDQAYGENFHQTAVQYSIQKHDVRLVVVDLDEEKVLEWID